MKISRITVFSAIREIFSLVSICQGDSFLALFPSKRANPLSPSFSPTTISLSPNFRVKSGDGDRSYVGYDLGSRTKRYKGHAYGLGVSYGYAWMLSKRWNIALEAGVGLYRTKDTWRDPTVSDWEDEYIYRYRRWTLAPSKMELSFSYIF